MRNLAFIVWLLSLVVFFISADVILHFLFNNIILLENSSFNRIALAGYSMEAFVSLTSFLLVIWKLSWALGLPESPFIFIKLIRSKTVLLSIGLVGLIGIIFTNSYLSWYRLLFTNDDYEYLGHNGAVNSVMVSSLLCIILYTLYCRVNDTEMRRLVCPYGMSIALSTWLAGWGAFVIGYINF